MISNKATIFFLLVLSLLKATAQDSSYCNQDLSYRKVGIYKTYDEFLKNEPSISKPLKLVRVIEVDYERKDTSWLGLTYLFNDNSKRLRKIWGFFDGQYVYHCLSGYYCFPVTYIGKISFTEDNMNCLKFNSSKLRLDTFALAPDNLLAIPLAMAIVLSSISYANQTFNNGVNISHPSIHLPTDNYNSGKSSNTVSYFDDKGNGKLLTEITMAHLLKNKNQIDLCNQFLQEKRRGRPEILIKYLMLLNKQLEQH